MRTAIGIIVGVAIGGVAMAGYLTVQHQAAIDAVGAEEDELERRLFHAQDALSDMEPRLEYLEAENERLRNAKAATTQPYVVDAPAEFDEDLFLNLPEEWPEAVDPPGGDESEESRESRWERRLANMTDEERQAMEERRAEMRARMEAVRAARVEFWENEYQRAPNAAVADRVAAIQEYDHYLRDLRDRFRDTDEEGRRALFGQMREAQETYGTLMREHRDYLLKEFAANYGVDDAAMQDQFLNSLRDVMRSPAFEDGRNFGGGRSFGGGQGFGRGGPGRGARGR